QEIIISGFLNPTPIKLKSENLKNIKILGDTKNIEISSEEESLKEVDEDSKRFLEIQYSVEGLNQWFNKEDFKNKLISLNGSLNDENWIIRREDIQARYALKKEYENGKIFIDVDGTNVNNNESQNQKYQLVNETNNTEFKGYINVDKIIDKFTADNFEVRGTDKSPKLIIKNYVELNQLFSRYSSNSIFEILYSDKADPNDFDPNNAIWNKNITQLTESIDLKGNFKNQFSLSFKGTDKYEVYKNDEKQDKGYILKTPEIKMVISIEINNPLNQKQIEFNFKDEQNQPIFYQNKGGFSIKIYNSIFESFISSLQLEQEQKNSL
ncbi:MAG: hypothetical protein IKJ72_01020, partial [Mycoplasmataceae bacterium]|nr:hypothetical protein [Mycoplasmataceae bacterium]